MQNKSECIAYKYNSYDEIQQNLHQMAIENPQFIEHTTASQLFNINHHVNCGQHQNGTDRLCEVDIIKITNRQEIKKKKQVYISGTLHGNEVVGPNSVFYFIQYLSNSIKYGEINFKNRLNHLLSNIEIVLTPMTNAVGFYRQEREEEISKEAQERLKNISFQQFNQKSVDINRDFPFNQPNQQDCLNTIAGRVVYKLYTENNFLASLTFHGGDNVVGYPWGAYSRSFLQNRLWRGYYAPDYNSFDQIGKVLSSKAGSPSFFHDQLYSIEKYIVGDISKTIYPVNGGLEDWAYGASWDTVQAAGTVFQCSPKTYPIDENVIKQSKNSQSSVKSLIYIIETDYNKKPLEWTLGSRNFNYDQNHNYFTIDGIYNENNEKENQLDGHINRNIRLIYALIEAVDPWIELVAIQRTNNFSELEQEKLNLKLYWKVNGCSSQIDAVGFDNQINDFKYQFQSSMNQTQQEEIISLNTNSEGQKLNCFQEGDQFDKDKKISLLVSTIDIRSQINNKQIIILKAIVDHQFGDLPEGDIAVQPKNITKPMLDISRDRQNELQLEIDIQALNNLEQQNSNQIISYNNGLIHNLNGNEDLDEFLKNNNYILFEGTEKSLPSNVKLQDYFLNLKNQKDFTKIFQEQQIIVENFTNKTPENLPLISPPPQHMNHENQYYVYIILAIICCILSAFIWQVIQLIYPNLKRRRKFFWKVIKENWVYITTGEIQMEELESQYSSKRNQEHIDQQVKQTQQSYNNITNQQESSNTLESERLGRNYYQ